MNGVRTYVGDEAHICVDSARREHSNRMNGERTYIGDAVHICADSSKREHGNQMMYVGDEIKRIAVIWNRPGEF